MTEVQQIFIGKGKIAFFSKMFEINSSPQVTGHHALVSQSPFIRRHRDTLGKESNQQPTNEVNILCQEFVSKKYFVSKNQFVSRFVFGPVSF